MAGDRRRRAVHRRRRGRAVRWGEAGLVDPERGSRLVDRRTGGGRDGRLTRCYRRRMNPAIRHPTPEEMPAFVTAMNTGFLEPVDAEKTEKVAEELRQLWDLERVWAAFDGDRPRRHVPLVRDPADGSRLRPGAGNGAHRRIRHGRPPPAGDPAGDGRRGARGRARPGRGPGAALLRGVPDLRPLRLRPGDRGGHVDARRARRRVPRRAHGRRRVRPAFRGDPGRDDPGLRGAAGEIGRRGRPRAVPLGLLAGAPAERLGRTTGKGSSRSIAGPPATSTATSASTPSRSTGSAASRATRSPSTTCRR